MARKVGFVGSASMALAVLFGAANADMNSAYGDDLIERPGLHDIDQHANWSHVKMVKTYADDDELGGVTVQRVIESKLREQAGLPTPLFFVNYSKEGDVKSDLQREFLLKVIPILATASDREIVFIDAVSIDKEGNPVFYMNQRADLKRNMFGEGATAVPVAENQNLLPYGYIAVDGEKEFDFSFAAYAKGTKLSSVQQKLFERFKDELAQSNRSVDEKSEPIALARE